MSAKAAALALRTSSTSHRGTGEPASCPWPEADDSSGDPQTGERVACTAR